ncbi:GAF and ANTAR domain-containing protein [Qaidamihabitans albus]|uniref:GAF and ANTAR domain-containing protein n=1 Tax=Qaidamihabitans albus TaxID=2795733 RepID=UPI0018F22D9C|nr:GAF and ANTAR domain-containing protein [Qaidamihabitans albus]
MEEHVVPRPAELDVAEALATAVRELDAAPDVDATVERVVAAAAANIPGTEHAGISLVDRKGIRTVAPSDELVSRIDKSQYQLGEGPCVDAIEHHRTYRTGNLREEPRWPSFGGAAADLGMLSMLSMRLFSGDGTIGALNLYSARPDAFDAHAEHIGELFAAHAAVVLRGSQRQAQFQAALQSRDLIGTAKGIVMQRHGVTGERAFSMLVEASQRSNRKLYEVAEWVVEDVNRAAGRDRS